MKKEGRNDLVIKLMKEKNKSEMQLASLLGKGPGTIYKITSYTSTPSDTTLKLISAALDVDDSYWDTGIIKERRESKVSNSISESPWKDEAYTNLKAEKEYFKSRYEKLLEILLTGKKPENLNFLKAPVYAGLGRKQPNQAGVRMN
jgi:transcriptional regulator with XRE-family HTH domain